MFDQYELAALQQSDPAQVPETVTFKSKTAQGTYNPYTLLQARRGARTEELVLKDGKSLVIRTIPWQIWVSDLANARAPRPKHGDELLDSYGTTFVVQKTFLTLMGQAWNLECTEVLK